MATNMNVSVTLRFVDQFTAGVRQLQQNLQQFARTAQGINQALGGTGTNSPLGRMQQQVRALNAEVRQLVGQFQQLGRVAGASSGGGFIRQQVAGMRQLLNLQQQALTNQTRLAGGGRGSGGPGGGLLGGRGFHPNASLADRLQYRGVNLGERSLVEGALGLDIARTQLNMLSLSEADQEEAERFAEEASRTFRALNRGHILESLREIIPQFKTTAEAFQFTPELLRIQDWLVLNGSTVEQARAGMLKLTRAVGLSGRLTGPEGNLTQQEASTFLEAYLRGAIIGGADVTPDQAFQLVKYLKSIGQTINMDEMLRMFIAMPDLGASTFGNSMLMFAQQLTGRATKEAMAAQERAGLIRGRIQPSTAGGPGKFVYEATVDEELLNTSPTGWAQRHIIGPQGYLRRIGIDPLTATPAAMREALRPLFSRATAENMANLIVNQISEWRNQVNTARGLDTSEAQRQLLAGGSLWYQLNAARSGLQDVLGSVAENFKLLLPHLEKVREKLGEIAALADPKIGNPLANIGVVGAGGIAGAIMAMRTFRGMSPWTRTAIGAGGGWMLGGVGEALTGAFLLRGLGGSNAAAAAGAAGAAAGRHWALRFAAAAARFLRLSAGIWVLSEIVTNWQAVAASVKGVWDDMRKAAPVWAGGEGQGWGAIGTGLGRLGTDLRNALTHQGILGPEHYLPYIPSPLNDEFRRSERPWWDFLRAPRFPWESDPDTASYKGPQPRTGNAVTVTGNPITINITTPPGADPKAIGDAAGGAVESGLRGMLGDIPMVP